MDNEYVAFLVIGVVIVAIVGRLLVLSGRRYITNATQATNTTQAQRRSAGSAATLVALMFYLLTLGIVALLSVMPVGVSGEQGLVVRVGILLVVLALIYGVALTMLSRRRQEAIIAEIETEQIHANEIHDGIRVEPVRPTDPDQSWHDPTDPAVRTATGQSRPDQSF